MQREILGWVGGSSMPVFLCTIRLMFHIVKAMLNKMSKQEHACYPPMIGQTGTHTHTHTHTHTMYVYLQARWYM